MIESRRVSRKQSNISFVRQERLLSESPSRLRNCGDVVVNKRLIAPFAKTLISSPNYIIGGTPITFVLP